MLSRTIWSNDKLPDSEQAKCEVAKVKQNCVLIYCMRELIKLIFFPLITIFFIIYAWILMCLVVQLIPLCNGLIVSEKKVSENEKEINRYTEGNWNWLLVSIILKTYDKWLSHFFYSLDKSALKTHLLRWNKSHLKIFYFDWSVCGILLDVWFWSSCSSFFSLFQTKCRR